MHNRHTNNKLVRLEENLKRISARAQLFRTVGMDCVELSTETAYVDEIVKFFKQRQKRR